MVKFDEWVDVVGGAHQNSNQALFLCCLCPHKVLARFRGVHLSDAHHWSAAIPFRRPPNQRPKVTLPGLGTS